MEKPITSFLEENITPDFSKIIADELSGIKSTEKENMLYIISLAYKDGIKDGLKLAAWLYE